MTDEVIINNSNIPVIRAGYANFIFLLLVVGLILTNQALIDIGVIMALRLITLFLFCILMLKIYTQSISKILIKNEELIIVGPISQNVFRFDEMLDVKVYGLPTSMTIFVKIKEQATKLPKFFFFIAVSTNHGTYLNTKIEVETLLEIRGRKDRVP